MIMKSFIGFLKPKIEYDTVGPTTPAPQEIVIPKHVTLFSDMHLENRESLLLKTGDEVKTGQKLTVFKENDAYVISSVTGTITNIDSYMGDQGRKYTAITIETEKSEVIDEEFGSNKEISVKNAKEYLACVPGKPALDILDNPEKPIKIIVVTGMDPDLMVSANQYVVRYNCAGLKKGIETLQKIVNTQNIVLTIPPTLKKEVQQEKMEAEIVGTQYPSALPHLIAKNILDQEVPTGQSFEDIGVYFINAEAVAAIGQAYEKGVIPVRKNVTVIDKDLGKKMISAVMGTPISSIIQAAGITVNDGDRVIIGGPLTGSSIHSLDYPVQPNTDAVMVQDKDNIAVISDSACINCGECIKTCPTKVPVNLLVRFLEAGEYQEAADNYDLFSCIDCGLCSFVCTAKIPIFQYIKLAKYEHALILAAEAAEAAEAEAEAEAAEAENA